MTIDNLRTTIQARITTERHRAASPDEVIHDLQATLTKLDRHLKDVAELMGLTLTDDQWHEFHSFTGAKRQHGSFSEFVTAPRYEGLGTTRERLLALISLEDAQLAETVAAHFHPEGNHQ